MTTSVYIQPEHWKKRKSSVWLHLLQKAIKQSPVNFELATNQPQTNLKLNMPENQSESEMTKLVPTLRCKAYVCNWE